MDLGVVATSLTNLQQHDDGFAAKYSLFPTRYQETPEIYMQALVKIKYPLISHLLSETGNMIHHQFENPQHRVLQAKKILDTDNLENFRKSKTLKMPHSKGVNISKKKFR